MPMIIEEETMHDANDNTRRNNALRQQKLKKKQRKLTLKYLH